MKILVICDEEDKGLWDYYTPDKLADIELILSCGDLNRRYLEFLATMAHCPLLYVHGNHDRHFKMEPPEGCIDIEDKIYDYKGLRILGLGGSMRYIPDRPYMYEESEMAKRISKLNSSIVLRNGFDILLTHSPAQGYGDMDDIPHRGFACFNSLMEKYHPRYMLHGHVHQTYSREFQRERQHPSGTQIINAYQKYILDVAPDEYPSSGKTGSFLYDLYMNMKSRRRHS